MKLRTKRHHNKKAFYILIFTLSFISTLKLIYKDKNILLELLINESVKNNYSFIEKMNAITNPKDIIYFSLNKVVPKNNLSVFSTIDDDEFDYDNEKTDYISDMNPEQNKEEPIVYIYNTHQTEEYNLNSVLDYSIKPNVMIASYIMREKLNEIGIDSLVETNNMKNYLDKYNYKYNMSYHASEYFARLKQQEYPSIKYMIDIHRDSAKLGTTLLNTGTKRYAKVLYVVGLEHTTAENNIGFAEKLHEKTENELRGLSRGISYKTGPAVNGIYNQNLNGKSVLIEIGGVDNTIEEVNNTIEVLVKIIKETITEEENA